MPPPLPPPPLPVPLSLPDVLSYETGRVHLFARPRLGPSAWFALAIAFAALGVGVLSLLGAALWYGVSPLAGAPAPIVGLFLLAVGSGVLVAQRRGRGHAVLAYVEQAVRLNLPLPAMMDAAERTERGRVRVALRAVRHRLEEGSPLAVAVASGLPSLPQRTVDLIASAERVGQLPQVLRRLTRPGRAEGVSSAASRGGAFLRWYPLLTLLVLGIVLALVCVFVMPKFEEMFYDFEVELPALTRWTMWAARTLVFPLTALLAVVAVILLGRTVGTLFAPGWAALNPLRRLTDRIAWGVPPFRATTRARAMADACHVIADAMESGRPLNWAIDEAARVQTNTVLESRLGQWAERVRQGDDPADAARAAGLPELFAGTLRTAPGGAGADLVRFLARYYDARFSRAAALTRAALLPAATLLTGIPVCAVVLSLFLPLTRLIDHMSEVTWSF